MSNRHISLMLIAAFTLISSAYALPSYYGPYYTNGGTYYLVNGSNGSLNSGDRVCAAVGMKCLGYTDASTSLCSYVHPNATVILTVNGVDTGYYCNGPPQFGECSFQYNTCELCQACGIPSCQDQIGDQYRQMFVQCATNNSVNVTTVPTYGTFAYMLYFWSTILISLHPIQPFLFGWSPTHVSNPSSVSTTGGSGAASSGARLCPMACYLYTTGTGYGGTADVNCNVNQSNVYKPLSTCAGTQTQVGQGIVGCSCRPDPTQPQACPSSCSTTQTGCSVNPASIGKSNIPCDGTVPGTSQNCKCAFINNQWVVGAQYGIH